MDRLRYPIGTFEPVPNPTPEQRSSWIGEMTEIPSIVRLNVQSLNSEQLETPYRPGGWTVRQVIHHMADNDMNAFIRFKRALTEERPIAGSYREDLWAELGDYQVPIEASLVMMESLYGRFAALLRSLHPTDFQRTFTSPTHGVMSLDTAMQRYAWHDRHHIAQIAALKQRSGWH
ncbi:YfiT family bacillithiol transferase [Paenibacillus piri]|uniref:Putative metal-dependent hydrolase n=1 Tax=Paenibacillus piri TaxID=2547395 RepID=A0A4R5KZT8_9BACL|nr:putative metal-dependent hydrolase [Paenibacillus piri]TDG00601.1 putative metal-dependent hydrolase [Paenibacillus piri]